MKNTIHFIVPIAFMLSVFTSTAQSYNIQTFAGNGTPGYSGDGGNALLAELSDPAGVALDDSLNLYIADMINNRIRKVNASNGIISTVAGNGVGGYAGDGGAATLAELNNPAGVAIDKLGNIYIADENNECIRKVSKNGIITTVAGKTSSGFSGDGGAATAAEMNSPYKVAVDKNENLYIADQGNSCIRKVDTAGIISTIAGRGLLWGYSGDGGAATAALLRNPSGVFADTTGNIYIADHGNGCIRMVNASGIISTVAGNGTNGYLGDGGMATSAELNTPSDMELDAIGDIYIMDSGNNRIRKVSKSTGIINTIAGDGVSGYLGDGGSADSAELRDPKGIAVVGSGLIYFADLGNLRIRQLYIPLGFNEMTRENQITLYPNPGKGIFNLMMNNPQENETRMCVYNTIGKEICSDLIPASESRVTINLNGQSSGMYFYRLVNSKGKLISSGKLMLQQ